MIFFSGNYASSTLHFSNIELLLFFITVQTTAILGSVILGIVADSIGQKKTIMISLVIWLMTIVLAYFTHQKELFYVVGLLAGIAMGSSQSTSRSLMSKLTPDEKKNEKVNGGSKPSVKVIYFVPKGTKPNLTVIRNRMVQAKKWFQSRDIGTLEFHTSVVYAKKNRSFYQANVWDKVNDELGLTCNESENGISIVIVDHPPLLRKDVVGLGRHCGDDISSGLTGHAMIAYEQLKGTDGLNTLIHEMGHALSLPQGDDSVPNAIMNPNCGINPATAVLLKEEKVALKRSPYFSQN